MTREGGGLRIAMLLHRTVVHDSRVRREAGALVAAGHEVVLVELAEIEDVPIPEGFRRLSVLPPAAVRRLPTVLYRLVFFWWFVRGVLRVRPDVVHAHDAAMLLPGLAAARLAGARLVYDSHELATGVPYRDRAWSWFVSAIERIGAPRADAVITVSGSIAERLRSAYRLRERPALVRNVPDLDPPDPERRGALRARLGIDGAPLVLHQGAAAGGRGCGTLIRAMAHLDPGVQLAFLGQAEDGFGRELAAIAGEAGVEDRVHFLASVPLDGLLSFTADADVGVTLLENTCENHRLALPNKLFEYVAAGVPVVASRLPEMERVVSHYGVGWTADPSDPKSVATAIGRALDAAGTGALRPGLERAARELRWDVEKGALLAVYDGLAPGANTVSRCERSGPTRTSAR